MQKSVIKSNARLGEDRMEFDKKLEIERRFIIAKPTLQDFSLIKKNACVSEFSISKIEQVYLLALGKTHRIRRRENEAGVRYYETVKRRVDNMSAIEEEREIDALEYESLKTKIRPGSRPISKTRYSFFYNGQSYEIDVYPFWASTAMMELELRDRDTRVEFLPEIRVIREVTGDKKYSNSEMANSPVSEEHNTAYL